MDIDEIDGLSDPTTLEQEAEEGVGENVLMEGFPSVGKSTQILTLPGKKLIYVFDHNCLQSLIPHMQGQDLVVLKYIPGISELDISIKTLKKDVFDKSARKKKIEPLAYMKFEEDFIRRGEEGYFDQFDWVCFDGLTAIQSMVMDRVQYRNDHLGKHPERGDYTAQMNTVLHLFRAIAAINANTYTTAHIEIRQDENTGKTGGQLVVTGRNRTQLPQLFTQIFGADCEARGDFGEYTIQTVQNRDFPSCRTNIQGVKVTEDVTLDFNKDLVGQGVGGIMQRAARNASKKEGQ